MSLEISPDGYVAKILTDNELVINLGSADGVQNRDTFEVIDAAALNIRDPKTQEVLGSLKRVKVRIQVVNVGERISLARAIRSRSFSIALGESLSGSRPTLINPDWEEGVTVGDPVIREPRSES